MVLSSVTAMLMCVSVLMLSVLEAPVWMLLSAMALGMAAVNYQCLFPLQKVMAPMLARDAARHGRSGPSWTFQLMYGRWAVVLVTLGVAALVLYSLVRTGRL